MTNSQKQSLGRELNKILKQLEQIEQEPTPEWITNKYAYKYGYATEYVKTTLKLLLDAYNLEGDKKG